MISLEQFRSSVLRDWQEDKSEACAVAAQVIRQAVCVHAKAARGTLLVTAHKTLARQIVGYITSFITDEPHLAKLPRKFVSGEEIHIGKLRILVLPVGTSRRPRHILWRRDIETTGTAAAELPSDLKIAIATSHGLTVAAHTGKEMDKALEIARWLDPNADEEWIQRNFGSKSGVETVQQQKERRSDSGFCYKFDVPYPTTSVPSVSRSIPDNIHPASREDWLASKEFEEMRMRQNEESDWLDRNRVSLKALTGPRR